MGAGAGQMRGMQQMMPQMGQIASRAPSRPSAAPNSGKGGMLAEAQRNAPQPFDANSAAPGQMTIDQFARSGMMGPTTQEFRNPVQFEGGSYDPALVSAFQNYRAGTGQAAQTPQQMPMRQIGDMGFMQPDQASMQAQMDDMARRRADPATMQMQMQAMQDQGRMQAPQGIAALRPQMTPGQMAQMQGQQQYMAQMQQQQAANAARMQQPMPQPTAASGKGAARDPRMTGGIAGMLTGQGVPMQSVPQSQYYQPMVRRTPGMAITPPQPPAPVRAPAKVENTQRGGGRDR